jgi:hypothetical protein
MSLGIAIKGPEGIVLAADSRVTLFNQVQPPAPAPAMLVPATFDNATKLLSFGLDGEKRSYIAAVTYGAGAIGPQQQPRTAHSFLPELDNELAEELGKQPGRERLSVRQSAVCLSNFFMRQWRSANMPVPVQQGGDMVFLVAGYDKDEHGKDEPYGKVFEVFVPNNPTPLEKIPMGEFGIVWGGQRSIADRILQGFDAAALGIIFDFFKVPQQQRTPDLENYMKPRLPLKIPIAFLPLQDCVDLATFIVRATAQLQEWTVELRGVGGAIDIATITRTQGFKAVRLKTISGDRFV